MEGPRIRLAFTIEELSAMALGRSARSSIMVTTNAWRAGVSNALITPWHTWRPSTMGTVMMPASARTASASD